MTDTYERQIVALKDAQWDVPIPVRDWCPEPAPIGLTSGCR